MLIHLILFSKGEKTSTNHCFKYESRHGRLPIVLLHITSSETYILSHTHTLSLCGIWIKIKAQTFKLLLSSISDNKQNGVQVIGQAKAKAQEGLVVT